MLFAFISTVGTFLSSHFSLNQEVRSVSFFPQLYLYFSETCVLLPSLFNSQNYFWLQVISNYFLLYSGHAQMPLLNNCAIVDNRLHLDTNRCYLNSQKCWNEKSSKVRSKSLYCSSKLYFLTKSSQGELHVEKTNPKRATSTSRSK